MFTGLIESLGTITGLNDHGSSIELTIKADKAPFTSQIGASISIDGTCLTVTKIISGGEIVFTAVRETLNRTTLAKPFIGRRVNLERALMMGGRLDGHLVLGHVDGVGRIQSDKKVGISLLRTISVPQELVVFMAEKGSVAIDGISLTIATSSENKITISLIPHTIKETTMYSKKTGDTVNIECDVLARYLFQMANCRAPSKNQSNDTDGTTLLQQMERFGF
ncbi:riboflavin synthase [Chitinispirillales bacterium ANBcel5]|uniref:riboflavin synthase n=1 Tax=Cellulosispirillum alkaliphilum TaxID=3039283 RepID=UPI002A54BFA9|nr:riboflavin synthase [Chitinispirillales bacterium ANBcel5]